MNDKQTNPVYWGIASNQDLRARGYEVFATDMSIFTLGSGGVRCLCQALIRNPAVEVES